MPWKIDIRHSFERCFRQLSREAQIRVLNAVRELSEAEDPSVLGEKLAGRWRGLVKLRVGEYRLVYKSSYEDRLIVLLEVKHRSQIYQR